MKNYKFSDFSGAYLSNDFLKHISKNEIKNIVELGARECRDTIALSQYYIDANIYAFECNPDTVDLCEYNLNLLEQNTRERIHFFPYGAGSQEESKTFYKFIHENNPGASSFYPRIYDAYKQKETEQVLKIVRIENMLKNNNVSKIDLVCADIQGFEIEALKGFGDYLFNVKYIITEIPKANSLYSNAPNRSEMLDYFNNNNFEIIEVLYENDYEDNVLLKKRK